MDVSGGSKRHFCAGTQVACACGMIRPPGHAAPVSVTVIASALVLAIASEAEARDLYVAPGGDDNDVGSETAPWETIGRAASSASAGDTVYIRGGTYAERLIPQQSGTPAEPVVFTAYPGESVTLDGAGLSGQGVVYINDVEHVQVSGLELINGNEAGVWIIDSSYITIADNSAWPHSTRTGRALIG